MNLSKKARLATLMGGLCAGLTAQTASADNSVIEEVIVTAAKRGDASTLDIPASISVASEDLISKRGMVGMEDYLRTLPSTNFLDRGAGRNGIIIRGVTASPQDDIAVGVYIDETPVTGLGNEFGGNPDLKYVDVQRIEVLRGPQGTLYGSTATGGVVNINFKQPVMGEIEGSGEISLGNYNHE
ncbi:MAG TPA: TonB-dependent receptor, partial [Gammaproteobacteria bacterium]|nr:TonB-dependent receptor [Gammaproteobacteria bacterium]